MAISRRSLLKNSMLSLAAVPFISKVQAAEPIKIAAIFDQSGGLDIYGQPVMNCVELAVDDINKQGGLLGRPVELVKYDPQSNIQYYTQFATQAATRDRVSAVFGGVTSASREAIRPILRRYKTPYFYPSLYEGGVCDRNSFEIGTTPAQTVARIVPYAVKQWGKKIYVIAADYNFGHISADWVSKYAKDSGAEVVATEFFPLDVTDFGTTIKKIQDAKPDMVFSLLVGGNHISFFRQWAAAGMVGQMPIASSDFGVGNENRILTPKESEGILAAYAYFQELETPVNKQFLQRLQAKFGNKTPYINETAIDGWYAVMHWANGVRAANSVERMPLIEALEKGSTVDGPGGISRLDAATHHFTVDIYLGQVKNGAWNILETYPQQPPSDTAAVCNLLTHPDDNQQYVIKAGG
ncbi:MULTISPECIES: ABC transporter substrate-binding protein [Pantoea]|uniref:Urea ABC transporter n=1 Tax=Pantoea septica TaxID=472695 RepID=A0ABX3UM84_9GAMM|nr:MULTISPECIES: ABC transporter substrate-binding protein [Pantoea]MDU5476060.1 ABC transporter substrate-binding protein [Pantoea sp.]ORM90864.1 urea ABC transporter [Pantoea septica]